MTTSDTLPPLPPHPPEPGPAPTDPGATGPVPAPPAEAVRSARRRRWLRPTGAGLVALAIAISSFLVGRASLDNTSVAPAAASVATMAKSSVAGDTGEPVADVAAALTPSIVQIDTQLGLGSGVVYDSNGLILTAAHVVGNARQVLVQTADGSKVDGTVVGADAASDVAVVRIDGSNLTPAPLATDETLRPGQMAIAIGSPFGLDQTVTAGVVSSVSRAVAAPDGAVRQLIQTDAPINPGNSGGALADRDGRVIGINDQIYTQSGGNEGVGFAIPIDQAKAIADRLVAGEAIDTAVLGVTGTDPTIGQAGALVTAVEPGSPAEAAGLTAGDLVVALDGDSIESFTDLAGAIRAHQPGDTITLSILRDGSTLDATATLASR